MLDAITLFNHHLITVLMMAWGEVQDDDVHPHAGYLGTGDMLIGLIHADRRVARFFRVFEVSPGNLREQAKTGANHEDICRLSPHFPYMIGDLQSTVEAWTVFCNTQREAGNRNPDAAASMLGQLLKSDDCAAYRMLSRLGRHTGYDVRKVHKRFRVEGLRRFGQVSQPSHLDRLQPF